MMVVERRLPWKHGVWLVGGPVILACAFGQLVSGAPWMLVFVFVEVSILSVVGVYLLGPFNSGALYLLLFGVNNVVVAAIAKSILGQTLNTHLYGPVNAYVIVAIGMVELLFALMLVEATPVGKPVLKTMLEPHALRFLSKVSFAFGLTFWVLGSMAVMGKQPGQGIGGFNELRLIYFMSIIAGTAEVLLASDGRKSVDWWVGFVLLVGVMLGFVNNEKMVSFLAVTAYFLTCLFFRARITKKQTVAVVLWVAVFVTLITPVVQVLRLEGAKKFTLVQTVEYIRGSALSDLKLSGLVGGMQSVSRFLSKARYYTYFGEPRVLLDRVSSVQQIDPVTWRVEQMDSYQPWLIRDAFARLAPGFLFGAKPVYSQGDLITWQLGFRNYGVVGYPPVPMLGGVFAADGWAGLLTVPFGLFLVMLFVLKKLGWHLKNNVFAIFFFLFVVLNAAQWGLDQMVTSSFRVFPLLAAVLWVLATASRHWAGERREVASG